MNPASLTSSSSSSASSSSASSSTSGHNGSASGGTQTPETDMIEMEDMMESGEREPLLGGKREQMGAGAHGSAATSSVTIEADGAAASARAGDPIPFPYLHTPYNPHQQGYGSAGSSTPPPSSASAASSVSPPPPAVNEREERAQEKGELDSSSSRRGGEETNSLTCAAVNEYVRQDTKAAAMVPERPFTSTNRDYSNFLTNQTMVGPTMYPSFAGPRFIGGPGTATGPAAEPESEKLRKMKAKKAKKESAKSSHDYTTKGKDEEWSMEQTLAALGEDAAVQSQQSSKKGAKGGSGSASSLKTKSAEKTPKSKQAASSNSPSSSTGSLPSGGKNKKEQHQSEEPQPNKTSVSRKNSGKPQQQASPSSEGGRSGAGEVPKASDVSRGEPSKPLPTSSSSIQLSTERRNAVVVGDAGVGSLEEGHGLKVMTTLEKINH